IAADRNLLQHGRSLRKLIVVISDQQKTSWQIGDTAAWQTATAAYQQPLQVQLFSLAPQTIASDLSVDTITIEPRLLGINRPAQILATTTNHGATDISNATVRVTVDGAPSSASAPTVTL